MFGRVSQFRNLSPDEARRPVVHLWSLFTAIAVALAVAGLAPSARADTIITDTAGTANAPGAQAYGQSVTTPTGGPWNNIQFNFYTYPGSGPGSTPFASGNIYLLSQQYSGTPQALSNLTSGYIASAAASGGYWVFSSSVTLQPGAQYWFYMDSIAGTATYGTNTSTYSGGQSYAAADAATNYGAGTGATDKNFTLSGTPVPGPLPGAGLLSYLVVGFGGAAAFRKKLRGRAAALITSARCALPAIALRRRGTIARAQARA